MIALGAVLHQEAFNAGELVCLRRKDDNIEFNVCQVLPGQL
jgi:hypothetical protein